MIDRLPEPSRDLVLAEDSPGLLGLEAPERRRVLEADVARGHGQVDRARRRADHDERVVAGEPHRHRQPAAGVRLAEVTGQRRAEDRGGLGHGRERRGERPDGQHEGLRRRERVGGEVDLLGEEAGRQSGTAEPLGEVGAGPDLERSSRQVDAEDARDSELHVAAHVVTSSRADLGEGEVWLDLLEDEAAVWAERHAQAAVGADDWVAEVLVEVDSSDAA